MRPATEQVQKKLKRRKLVLVQKRKTIFPEKKRIFGEVKKEWECVLSVRTSHFLSIANIFIHGQYLQPYSGTREDAAKDCEFPSIQNTHGRPPFTLPATLPVTRIFSHYPTRTLPEIKNPSPSQPAP